MAEVSAGRILIMAVGNYNAATPYEPLDLVAYNDESWLCRKACTGVTPTAQASEYWQKFGSAVGIATVTNTGVVRPDGSSIKIIADGTISVPTATGEALGLVKPDGSTITIDANGTLTANAAGALSDLTDVNISSASQGQILQYNVTSHKWENVTKQFLTELEQMADVDIDNSTLADGQALIYDVATGKWQNKAITQYPKLDTVEQVMANTQSGKVADALVIKTINTNLQHGIFELWKNPNVAQTFAGQSIVLTDFDSNKYDAIVIACEAVVGEAFGAKWVEFDKEVLDISQYTGILHDVFFSGTSIYFTKRDVTFSLSGSSLTITFGNGITGGTSGTPGTDNTRMVPVRVLGLVHND